MNMNMKMWHWLIPMGALMGLSLLAWFTKYPYFSPYQSADFILHAEVSRDLAASLQKFVLPPIQESLLYYGVEFYLAGAVLLTKGSSFFVDRYAMAVLVLVSLPVVYLCVKEVAESVEVALVSASLYSIGSVWFVMVFDSGLYPNFYGILGSLMLAAATTYFVRNGPSPLRLILFLLAITNALFGHYSVLVIWPALLVWLGWEGWKDKSRRNPAVIASILLTAPLLAGAVFYRDVIGTMLGFLSSAGPANVSYTYLGSLLQGWPFLGYSFDLMNFDLGTVIIFALALFSLRRLDSRSLIPSTWFFTAAFASPLNSSAWRFAAVGLTPLLVMAAFPLASLLKKQKVVIGRKSRWVLPRRAMMTGVALLLLFPGAWGGQMLSDSLNHSTELANYQQQTLSAIQWMGARDCGHLNSTIDVKSGLANGSWTSARCSFLDLTDWHFTLSPYLGGPLVSFNASLTAPELASFYAASHGFQYLIVSNITSLPTLTCYSESLLTLTVENYSSTSAALKAHYFTTRHDNFSVAIFINGTLAGTHPLVNLSSTFDLSFSKKAVYDVVAAVGGIYSDTERFFALTNSPPLHIPQNPNSCQPFYWTSRQLFGARLDWSSKDIKIWRLTA